MFDPVDSLFTPLAELADEAGVDDYVDLIEFGLAAGLVTEVEAAAVESWIDGPNAGDSFDGYDDRDPHCFSM